METMFCVLFVLSSLPLCLGPYIYIYKCMHEGSFRKIFFENLKVLCFWHFIPHFFWQVPTNGNHVLCFVCSLLSLLVPLSGRGRCRIHPPSRKILCFKQEQYWGEFLLGNSHPLGKSLLLEPYFLAFSYFSELFRLIINSDKDVLRMY